MLKNNFNFIFFKLTDKNIFICTYVFSQKILVLMHMFLFSYSFGHIYYHLMLSSQFKEKNQNEKILLIFSN